MPYIVAQCLVHVTCKSIVILYGLYTMLEGTPCLQHILPIQIGVTLMDYNAEVHTSMNFVQILHEAYSEFAYYSEEKIL